jgi:hypothetical protein
MNTELTTTNPEYVTKLRELLGNIGYRSIPAYDEDDEPIGVDPLAMCKQRMFYSNGKLGHKTAIAEIQNGKIQFYDMIRGEQVLSREVLVTDLSEKNLIYLCTKLDD